MPHFGPRKVGAARFKASALHESKTKKFGPRKFGVRKAAEMQAALDAAEAEAVAAAQIPVNGNGEPATTSLAQLREALSDNPAVADELYALELARAGGARKGAVKMFLSTELARPGGARPDRQEELEALLTD
ncbi:MAG: hypothetical protein OEO20_11240 [Gemmatimonadota bacterium]|nr:hypothetical protein [Gemmatimonadota bacterium]MDH3368927.1 hypothetical protein [Gemmatimonadota bacterium]MDH3478867.1 hypothetical protein [Gemmatimonadota bacterium]MDH3571413.1 hypothetical protein [Gemmatimonadota bacterium]